MFKLYAKPLLISLCLGALFSAPSLAQANAETDAVIEEEYGIEEEQWELINQRDGVETYRMRHAGTDIQTFRGVAFVDAKIEVVGEVLRDINRFPTWMHKFKDTKILKTIDRNTYIFHTEIKTPFIYKNRDLVIANETFYNFDNGTAKLKFWVDNQFDFPEKKGLHRITDLNGEFLLEYFGRDKTRVSYQYRANPGGNIPISLANEIEVKHYPRHTLAKLRERVKEQQYIKAGRASPEFTLIEEMLDDRSKVRQILRNRLREYITDDFLVDTIFSMPESQIVVDIVYENRSDFNSIREAMVSLFKVVGQNMVGKLDEMPEIKADLEKMMVNIQDKPFESIFDIEKFMLETWLVDEISQHPQIVQSFLKENSDLAFQMFEKITTSEVAVKSFIRNKRLAQRILTDATTRQQLWLDQELRRQLGENYVDFTTLKDFEKLIQSRVKTYKN